jgi:LacI family transcriptional regulator
MGKRRVRLQDIAEKAGVSVSTVSLVLNDKAMAGNVRISDQTIQRVRRTAFALGYLTHGTVGLVMDWISESFELRLIYGITEVFKEAHYNLAMGVTTDNNLDVEVEEIRAMDNKGFEGLILRPSLDLMAQLDLLHETFRNWKHVVLINKLESSEFSTVTVDQVQCGYLATRHLLDCGHRKIACLTGGTRDHYPLLDFRFDGYKRAMSEAGFAPVELVDIEGKTDVSTLVKRKKITALFCCRYLDAADVLGHYLDRELSVPDDLSIVGVADDREKRVVRPQLTTVDVKPEEMGQHAAEMVLNLIDGKSVQSVVLEPELLMRDSVRAL